MARKTFSMHKHRPLIKFMSIVLPDGYVLDAIGPYFSDGRNNDAGMTWDIFQEKGSKALAWIKSYDKHTMVVNRGFRNVISKLDGLGVEAKMPSIDSKGTKQTSTGQANKSRLVTKVRWVVEAYHS